MMVNRVDAGLNLRQNRIAVVSATFNSEGCIGGLIASLQNQTDPDFIWVVQDGGSSDSTLSIISETKGLSIALESRKDGGIYDALNSAVSRVDADYYVVAGADDILYPGAIREYRRIADESNPDLISAPVLHGSKKLRPGRGLSWLRGQNAYISNHSLGVAIKTSLHTSFGKYDLKLPIAADQLFIKRVAQTPTSKLEYSEEVVGYFSEDGVSTRDLAGLLTECYRVQLRTERYPFLQTLVFVGKILKNILRLSGKK